MLEVISRYRLAFSCAFFLLISLSLATVNIRSPYRIDPMGVVFLGIMQPLQVGVTTLSKGTEKVWRQYKELLLVHQANETLKVKMLALEQTQDKVTELQLANQRLELLLGLRAQSPLRQVAARVIGRNPSAWSHTAVIDKGSKDGITKGMAVLTPAGVVGQVVSVSANASHLLLISAANSGVDALVQRTRVPGILSGSVSGKCLLKYVQRGSDVSIGDAVITSGLDGVFPKGQQLGRVIRTRPREDGMFQDVEVMLSAELAKIEEVLVVAPVPDPIGATEFR